MIDDMTFTITRVWIENNTRATSGFTLTSDQANIIKEPWPLKPMWMDRAIGKQLTLDQAHRFELRLTKKQLRGPDVLAISGGDSLENLFG